jgi:hypothetical protein
VSLIIDFVSLFFGFISLFGRVGNLHSEFSRYQRPAGTYSVAGRSEIAFFAVSSRRPGNAISAHSATKSFSDSHLSMGASEATYLIRDLLAGISTALIGAAAGREGIFSPLRSLTRAPVAARLRGPAEPARAPC